MKPELARQDQEFEVLVESLMVRADVTWDDIAGLDGVKKALMKAYTSRLPGRRNP